jgi:hypothetical protein
MVSQSSSGASLPSRTMEAAARTSTRVLRTARSR